MSGGRVIRCALIGLFTLVLPGVAWPQDDGAKHSGGSQGDQSSPARPNAAGGVATSHRADEGKSDAGKKPALARVTRVSTEEAIRWAAAEAARKNQKGVPQPDGSTAQDSAVVEFRPVDQGGAPSDAATILKGKSNKSALKNMHGSVYGSTVPGNRGTNEAAGSVGTTSRSGKTSVYIETDRSRASPSH